MAVSSKTCCPTGYTYIDINGMYYDPITSGYKMITNNAYTNPTFSSVVGQCGHFVNSGFVGTLDPLTYPATVEPEDCPCCPDEYTWSAFLNKCWKGNASQITDPIPCIVCTCAEVVPQECPTCGTLGEPINFQFDFFSKACTDCVRDNYCPPKGRINCFMPYFFADPLTNNFKLKP